ncbi:MAG: hypothetical protein QOD06_2948 [Candidatus Binatota bacterium]|nr:hypothetical protein [Candidatus Binatota bacterium]
MGRTMAALRSRRALVWMLAAFALMHVSSAMDTVTAAESKRETAGALLSEGITDYRGGKYQEAVETLGRARALAPDNSSAALYLGLAYLRLGKTAEAIGVWQEYTKLAPATEEERRIELRKSVGRYLTLLLREENHRLAQQAVAAEKLLGAGDSRTVAITYYKNLGSTELDPLAKGLTALLIDDVSKVKELRVVERERMQALLEEAKLGTTGLADEKTAPKVGRLLGAGKVATGSYVDDDQELRVSSIVAESGTAAVVGSREATGKIDEFYRVEKALAFTLLQDLGYDRAELAKAGLVERIEKPQTRSMPALVEFSKGLDAKDRGDFRAARAHFEQALKEDPNFDLAKRELALLPLLLIGTQGIISAVEASAPAVQSAAAGIGGTAGVAGTTAAAGGLGTSTTAAIVAGGVAVVGGAAAGGAAAAGAFGGGGGNGGGGDTCPSDQFRCNDGSCIPRNLVCNTQPNCPGGDDESLCTDERSCCVATAGCPGETGSNCADTCCCCGVAEACCADLSGCCPSQ